MDNSSLFKEPMTYIMIRHKSCLVCITYNSALTMENHPDDQNKSSPQLGGSAIQSQIDCPNPLTNYGRLITL